ELGIEHRLTRPKRPQTNGMVERFNGRIADILRTHHFRSGEELEATLLRYVWLYNHHLPQKALGHVSPIEAMKRWQRSHPELFHKRVINHPRHNTYSWHLSPVPRFQLHEPIPPHHRHSRQQNINLLCYTRMPNFSDRTQK